MPTAEEKIKDKYPLLEFDHAHVKDNGLNQIYSTGMQLSIVNGTNRRVIPWILCKDYVQDLIWGTVNQKPISQYGYSFKPEMHSLTENGNKLLIRNKDVTNEELIEWLESSMAFVNAFFRKCYSCKRIKIMGHYYDGAHIVIVINFPEEFFIAGPLSSLFLLMIRVGGFFKKEGFASYLDVIENINDPVKGDKITFKCSPHNDRGYLRGSYKLIKHMLKNGIDSVFQDIPEMNWHKDLNSEQIHNNTGIVSFTKNYWKEGEFFHDSIKKHFRLT